MILDKETVRIIILLIIFFWGIYKYINNRRGNLKVDYTFAYKWEADEFGNLLKNTVPYLVIKIINRGQNTRNINTPLLKLSKEIEGFNTIQVVRKGDKQEFPYKLNPGDEFKKEMNLFDFEKQLMDKLLDKDNLRLIITDTFMKKYKSRIIKIKDIKSSIKIAKESDLQ